MKSIFLFCLLLAQVCVAQVAFVDRKNAPDFRNASRVVVLLAAEDAKTLQKISKKKNADYAGRYRKMVADYNASLRAAFAADWTLKPVEFMTRAEFAAEKNRSKDAGKMYFIGTGLADEALADAARWFAKRKMTDFDLDAYLVASDETSSLDIASASQLDDYFTPRSDWDLIQQKKMALERKQGKNPQAGDYLKHRMLEFVGFCLLQHAVMTRSDLHFALSYLQADLERAFSGSRMAGFALPPTLSIDKLASKTLLIGRDLTNFPNGKVNLTEEEIKKVYPHPFRVVAQAEIEKAFADKNKAFAAVVPGVRWSATGYPELLLFYAVDAQDGRSILAFADTGSGSNAMTAGQFERSQELKAKHFQEFITLREE